MTDREKLFDLMMRDPCPSPVICDPNCEYYKSHHCHAERYADHLIANGVTLGKPLTEYLHPIDTYEGLKSKYLVFKADTGEQVVNCFVLRPDKDAAAVEALRAYANSTTTQTLAEDIYNWVGKGETVQKWIPVTEMPPKKGCYLVTVRHWCDGKPVTREAYYTCSGWISCERGIDITERVIHWMPLPEPPKGE